MLNELQQSTLNIILMFIGGAAATLLWIGNIQVRTSPGIVVLLWIALESVCALGYLLSLHSVPLSSYILIFGLWLLNVCAINYLGFSLFLYLFSLISLLTSVLLSGTAALSVCVSSSIVIWLSTYGADLNTITGPMLMLWATLAAGLIAFRSLKMSLGMALDYQNYAIKQMSEAREHRATLMQITKVLNEARQEMERTNTQLFHTRKAAEESRRLKTQFAANVSHELRTPINLIVGFSEAIVSSPQSYGVALPPVYWSDLHTIYRSARHLQSLINDVLDVSQIEAGKMSVVKEEILPQQVINEAANLVRDLIESKGLALILDIPEDLPAMFLDRTRIRQVLLNLLSNAARFTDHGTITVQAALESGKLKIDVKDTGIGIAPKYLQSVFDEFYQVEGSLSRRQGGSGLGLTLSKYFVELHGGRIWAESDGIPGKGSIFSLVLPLLDQSLVTLHNADLTADSREKSERYFVIYDDDPSILQLFERHTKNHRAISVREISEAIRLVTTIRPSAVVIDDRKDNAALLEALQSNNNPVPLIACNMPSGRRLRENRGVTNYLSSPISLEALRDAIDQTVPLARNILIIDPDQDVVRMFSRMLTSLPQSKHIRTAYSGMEGLALMKQQRPDLVILELSTIDEGDVTVIQRMKDDPGLINLPVILVSIASSLDELIPASEGKISISRAAGFQPIEIVRCVEALIDGFIPASEPTRPESPPVSAV